MNEKKPKFETEICGVCKWAEQLPLDNGWVCKKLGGRISASMHASYFGDKSCFEPMTEKEELVRRIDLQNSGDLRGEENLNNNKRLNDLVDKEQEGTIK